MTTEKKVSTRALKRTASGTEITNEEVTSNVLQSTIKWSNDHEFLSPHEIYTHSIGLLFCLTRKRLISISFTNLYQRSLNETWINLLNRQRRILKPNINSTAKCFAMNRLIIECSKNPCEFARQTGELYEEIRTRMSSQLTSTWTLEDFYNQVLLRRTVQCQRRLFHFNHDEINQPQNLLTLQFVASKLFSQFLTSCRINPNNDNYNNLKKLLQHCFLILAQPSIPECVAATKYEKSNNTYTAKIYTCIVCLLDSETIERYLTLDPVGVTLYPFDRQLDQSGEVQQALTWRTRSVGDFENNIKTFYYIGSQTIELKEVDKKNLRPIYSAKLCQLEFQLKFRINEINFEDNLTLLSQLFGLCSHAQYYPEFVAKVLLHEVTQMPQSSGSIIQPDILLNYIHRYHIRVSGVEPKTHTSDFITNVLKMAYEKNARPNATSSEVYEEIVAKILSQIDMYYDYPFLSMMYQDGLFLGICDNTLDQKLYGTREQPHLLLRFNTLQTHQANQHVFVRFIVHNGQLTRATFHNKAFVDEMCRMIGNTNSSQAVNMRLYSDTGYRAFQDFSLYFDEDLYRLNTAAAPLKDAYKPLIPVLWNTMRINTDEQLQESSSPSLISQLISTDPLESNSSSINEIQIDLTNVVVQTDMTKVTDEKLTIRTELLVRHLVEKLSDLITKPQTTENVSSTIVHINEASRLLSSLTDGDHGQQRELISRLLLDSFQSKSHNEVATQTSSSDSSTNISKDT